MVAIDGLKIGWAKQRDKTHCKNGHAFTPENTLRNRDGHRVCWACRRLSMKKANKRVGLPKDRARLVVAAIDEGRTISNITGNDGQGNYNPGQRICSWHQLQNFMTKNPSLRRRLETKLASNAKAAILRANRSRRIIAAPALMKNNGADAWEAVAFATRDLPPQIKDEMQGDLIIAIGEGRLRIADIRTRLREFVTARNRIDRNSVFNPWGHLSLEKPVSEDGTLRLVDVIREDQRLW